MRNSIWIGILFLAANSAFAQESKLQKALKDAPELKGWTPKEGAGNPHRPGSVVRLRYTAKKGHGYLDFIVLQFDTAASAKKAMDDLSFEDRSRRYPSFDYSARPGKDKTKKNRRTWPWRIQRGGACCSHQSARLIQNSANRLRDGALECPGETSSKCYSGC